MTEHVPVALGAKQAPYLAGLVIVVDTELLRHPSRTLADSTDTTLGFVDRLVFVSRDPVRFQDPLTVLLIPCAVPVLSVMFRATRSRTPYKPRNTLGTVLALTLGGTWLYGLPTGHYGVFSISKFNPGEYSSSVTLLVRSQGWDLIRYKASQVSDSS
jgi:hypothetical protein